MALNAKKSSNTNRICAMIYTVTAALAMVMASSLPLESTSMGAPPVPSVSNRRVSSLSTRDFGDFNKIFENASILIPEEFKVSEKVAFVDLDINIRNIKCYDMAVGDISVDHEQNSDTTFFVTVGVTQLDLTCEMDYIYSYGILSGDGWVQIQTQNSEASSTISFTSLDFNQNFPPTDSAVDNCFSDVEIKKMDFEEDFASEVLEIFQSLIRNTVEVAIGDVACEELSVIGTNVVGNMIDMAVDRLEPYLGPLDEEFTDPLYFERNLILPDNLEALNLQNAEEPVEKTFNEILKFLDKHLGTSVSDVSEGHGDSSSTSNELVINNLLRSFFLDEDGSLRLDPSSMMNPIIFEGHDRLTEFTFTWNEVRLYGLDTITRFNSFRNIGEFTLQNELTWNMLKFEFDIVLNIKPSKLDDAILIDPSSPGISEHFSINFVVNNVDVEASLLLVLDKVAMGTMKLGSFFNTENLLPCLLSIIHKIKLSGLDVDPSYINDGPTVEGFLSSGLDHVISESVEAAFAMYKGSLRSAIPNIFQTSVRDLINIFFVDIFIDDSTNSECPESQLFEGGAIDFRKFFNSKDGGYGDLPLLLKDILDNELLISNPKTGRPRINEALIAPITGAQSGTKGALNFPIDLFGISIPRNALEQFGIEALDLRIFDPQVVNLDTVGAPIQLLEPNATHGQVIDNFAKLGSVERNLRIALKALFSIEGDSALSTRNQMDMSVEFSGADAWLSLMAHVDTATLFNFPLQDITNIQCWLHTIASPEALDGSEETGLSILNALLETTSMNLNLTCANCTSLSDAILPEVLGSLEANGVLDVVEKRLVQLLLELLRSDYSQNHINGILMDADIRCPHSPEYIGPSASHSESSTEKFSSLGYRSLETLVFISTVTTSITSVVMARAHESYELQTSFPLSGQSELGDRKDVRLLDFNSLDASLGTWASSGITNIIDYFNDIVDDPTGLGEKSDLGINILIRSHILDDNGYFSVKFDDLNLKNIGMGISLKEVKIVGLDTISEFNIFEIIGAQTIMNKMSWEDIGIQLVLSLEDSEDGTLPKEHDIIISVQLSNISLSLAILLAIDLDLFDSLQLWSMMVFKSILPCVLSTADTASITELELSIGSISGFSIEGFRSNELSASANESGRLILEKYGDMIISSIPKVFDSTVRTLLNNWLKYQMDKSSDVCEYWPSNQVKGSEFVDLRDLLLAASDAGRLGGTGLSQYGDIFRMAIGLVQNIFKIDDSTGLSGFNEAVVVPLTKSKDNELGTLRFPGDLFKEENTIKVGALDANVELRAYDAKIENLNTIGAPLDLLRGIMGEAYMLNNTLTAGVREKHVQFSTKILLSLEGDENIDIRNEFDLSLAFGDINMIISTFTKILETRLLGFPLRDFFNLNCWLATIPAPALDPQGVRKHDTTLTASLSNLEARVGEVVVNAQCIDCSSPRMTELTDLISSPDARNETTVLANSLLAYVTEMMGGNFLQVQIDRILNEAARKCPHSPSYDPNTQPFAYEGFEAPNTTYSIGNLILFTVISLTVVVIVLAIILTVKCIVRRRHRKWLITLPPHQIKNLSYEQKSRQYFEDKLNSTSRSMFRDPDVPCIVRFAIPIVIVCNVLFFLSGHLSLGATVNIEAEVAGEKFSIENFFEFSMARSTIDIWKAGGRELAVLILIFSGIWPYTKLLITLWLWFSSPSNVSISRRGSILLWLDWLAKWSMIDIFVLVISIAAFRISIESPDTSYLPDDFYAIEMMVIPLWGLYANMIAQLLSQISSHIIIYYHRRIVANSTERLRQGSPRNTFSSASTEARSQSQDLETSEIGSHLNYFEQEQSGLTASIEDITSVEQRTTMSATESTGKENISLSTFQFSRPHRGDTEKLVVRGYVNKLLLACAFSIVVCVVTGCVLTSFSLELFGLVGVAVEFGQDFEEATFNHSVFSVIKLLFEQAGYLGTPKDYVGLTVLSILFVSTILFVPIIQSIILLRQWFSVSTVEQKRKIAELLEVLQAWQYLEVYIVAVFLSSWQLGSVSDFMINAYCKNLEEAFSSLVYFGILKEEDAQCFAVTSRIGNNAFVLVAGAVLLTFLNSFVCKAIVQYLREEAHYGQRLKGNHDFNFGFQDDTSRSNNDNDSDEMTKIGANILPVPVLFTDSFRWMLKASNGGTFSNRTLVADPNNNHWSLPEATVVTSDNLPTNDQVMKGTYVHDLASAGMVNTAVARGSPSSEKGIPKPMRQDSIDLSSKFSCDSYQFSPRGMELKYAHGIDGKHSHRLSYCPNHLKRERTESFSSLGQLSISSKMDSIGDSSNGEQLEAHSPVCSVKKHNLLKAPPREDASVERSPATLRKAPPPSAYRLSRKSSKKTPPNDLLPDNAR